MQDCLEQPRRRSVIASRAAPATDAKVGFDSETARARGAGGGRQRSAWSGYGKATDTPRDDER